MVNEIFTQNLFSPPILFFALGIIAGFLKSDLNVPESISRYFSIYLMMSIGFKGGVVISDTDYFDLQIILVVISGILLSFLQPFLGYFLLKKTTKIDNPTAAALAAHYGSISIVTFITATSFLKAERLTYGGYIVAILALMEAPAILSGLYIAHRTSPETLVNIEKINRKLSRDIFTNGAILLLFGSFIIGWISGQEGFLKVEQFLNAPFQGILCFFLLDMGLVVASQFHNIKNFNLPLIMFGIYMPLIGAALGLFISKLTGLDIGSGMLFTVLCASASYIAVPAAMRLALPQAQASIYIPMSLAVTFPFNILFGIPIYYMLARLILN